MDYVCLKCRTFAPGGHRTFYVYDDNGTLTNCTVGRSAFQCVNCEGETKWVPAMSGEIGGNWDALPTPKPIKHGADASEVPF